MCLTKLGRDKGRLATFGPWKLLSLTLPDAEPLMSLEGLCFFGSLPRKILHRHHG